MNKLHFWIPFKYDMGSEFFLKVIFYKARTTEVFSNCLVASI